MRNVLSAVVITLCLLVCLILRCAPFSSILSKQKKQQIVAAQSGICVANILILIFLFNEIGMSMSLVKINILFFGIVTTIANILLVRGRIRQHIFVYGIVVSCNNLIMSIPIYLVNYTVDGDRTIINIITVAVFVVLMVATFKPIKYLLKKTVEPFLIVDSDNYWKSIWVVPVAMYFSMYLAFPGNVQDETLFSILSKSLICMSAIFICISNARFYKGIYDQGVMEEQLETQRVHYAKLQERLEEIRRVRHDFKHHMTAFQNLVEAKDMEGLKAYFDDWSKEHADKDYIPYTGNAAVDGIMFKYMQLCEEKNISFKYSGTIKNNGIANLDICILLGNALDNAYNGCLTKPENASIKIVAQSEAKTLSIMVVNSFDGIVKQEKNGLLISRRRVNKAGVGMASMHAVCDKYGGTMERFWAENTFTIVFVLPIN